MKILITGASGFIGSFLVDSALEHGYEVWAAVRRCSSREYLGDSRIKFIELNFADKKELQKSFQKFTQEYGRWDCIIHAAGATKCLKADDFVRINYEGTRNFAESLIESSIIPNQFIYLSSLSVFGPIREDFPYQPILESDKPQPNTAYGTSKLMAEEYLKNLPSFPYLIFRPTGVYGPREKDYFMMAKSIKNHMDFAVGYKPQQITFIYVKDLVKAIFLAIVQEKKNRCYFVSEDRAYNSRSFSNYIEGELNNPFVIHIKAPLWFLKFISIIAEKIAVISQKPSTLNSDKYKIMSQRNWLCDTTNIKNELGFHTDYDLQKGTKEMMAWYKTKKWL